MADPDPIHTGLVVAGTISVLKRGEDFITAALGHPGESIGTVLGNSTKRRLDNIRTICGKAGLTLLNIGVQAGEIPLKTMQPALEAASLEEDAYLQERWANLLANAADPRHKTPVLAIFATFLRDMGATEVKFLDGLYGDAFNAAYYHAIFKNIPQIAYTLRELMDHFVNFGLAKVPKLYDAGSTIQETPDFKKDTQAFWIMLDIIQRHNIIRDQLLEPHHVMGQASIERLTNKYHFSDIGAAFVKACRPPTP